MPGLGLPQVIGMHGVNVVLPAPLSARKTRSASAAMIVTHGHEAHIVGIPAINLKNFSIPGGNLMAPAWPCRCCKGRWRSGRSPIAPIHPDGEPPRNRSRWASTFKWSSSATPTSKSPTASAWRSPLQWGVDCLTTGDFKFVTRPWMANNFDILANGAITGEQGVALPVQ